jgi:glycosyltransferase involved in cell wall biosynthesis
MEKWLSQTIESVLNQKGDFEIEYILVNDGSIDNTENIIKHYQDLVSQKKYPIKCRAITIELINQNNAGANNAMNTGFAQMSGDICTWLDGDNIFDPDAFIKIQSVFLQWPDIKWIKGITSTIDEKGLILKKGFCKIYKKSWLAQGIYGKEAYFVEADSVFFKPELWRQVGPIPDHFRSAGDYWLWINFAKVTKLWSFDTPISYFRKRSGQLSKNISNYTSEQKLARPKRTASAWKARLFFSPQSRLDYKFPKIEKVFTWLYPKFFNDKRELYITYDQDNNLIKKEMLSYRV